MPREDVKRSGRRVVGQFDVEAALGRPSIDGRDELAATFRYRRFGGAELEGHLSGLPTIRPEAVQRETERSVVGLGGHFYE